MPIIRTDASRSSGGESTSELARTTTDDSYRVWRNESPDDFFYLRENRQFTGQGVGAGLSSSESSGPKKNPLHKYATYSWMWSLNVLTQDQTNNPESLCKGRAFRAGITVAEDYGSTDYHFENVQIKSIVGMNPGTRSATALTFKFDIVEPYSMGGFLEDLDDAARRQGFANYADAGMMLACKFDGYLDDGSYSQEGPYNFIVKLISAKFTVTEAGSLYKCYAIAWNDQAFSEEISSVKTQGTISGRTVQEILSTGEQSLQSILNQQENEAVETGAQKEADQYYIVFPETTTSAEEQAILGTGSAGLVDNPVDWNQLWESVKGTGSEGDEGQNDWDNWQADTKKYSLGTTKSAHSIGTEIFNFYKSNLNEIGKSELKKQPEDTSVNVNTNYDNYLSEDYRQIGDNKNSRVPLDLQTMGIFSGQKILNIIEEVIIASKYGREGGVWKDADGDNKITWFKVQPFVLSTSGPKEQEAGRTGKIYIYRIVPYKAALNRFSAPGTKGKGGGQPSREYNYIYTGKNNDILELDLNFNYSFYIPIGQDLGMHEKTRLEGLSRSQTDSAPESVNKMSSGRRPSSPDELTNIEKQYSAASKNKGNQLPQHPESQVNRYWHETLMNSPVDLLTIKMKIHGDPYFMTNTGCGNFIDSGQGNETSLGLMEYVQGEADILINFETPYDADIPWYKMEKYKFTGMYQVLTVDSEFTKSAGFTQTLNCLRHRQQGEGTSKQIFEEGNIGNSVTLIAPGTPNKGTM